MIAALVGGRKHPVVGRDDIVFKFAHCLEFQPGFVVECTACFSQGLLRRSCKRVAILIEEAAKHADGRDFGKWVAECRGIAWNHVKVAVAGFDE